MVERIEPGGSRLAPLGVPHAIPVAPPASAGSVMRLPHGDVVADFQPTGKSGARGRSSYELVVSNDTAAPLATFAYACDGTTLPDRLTWQTIVVPPHSAVAVEIEIALPGRWRTPRVVASVITDDAHLTLDAPPRPSPRGVPRGLAAALAAAVLVAAGATAYAQARTRVLALAAPPSVKAATPFTVAYELGHASRGRYAIETADGLTVSGGPLAGPAGAFTVVLPSARVSTGYDVRVTADGALGSAERTAHVVAESAPVPRPRAPRPRPKPAPVLAAPPLALERDTVHGGDAIVVTYPPSADAGVVRLIDQLGTVRAEALRTPRGRSILLAPTVDVDQDFRIVATLERGTARSESQASVTILHGPPPAALTAAAGTDAAGTTAAAGVARGSLAATVNAPRTGAPIAVDPVARRGRPIVVRIDRFEPGMHVALVGGTAQGELAAADVTADQQSVALTPPPDLPAAPYAIVTTYGVGLGTETLVRPISFRAP